MPKIKIAFGTQKMDEAPVKKAAYAKKEDPMEDVMDEENMDDDDYSFIDVMRLLKDRLEGDDTEAALNIVNEFIYENASKKEGSDLKEKIASALSDKEQA